MNRVIIKRRDHLADYFFKNILYFIALISMISCTTCFAEKAASDHIIIDHTTVYKNVTIDLQDKSFIINNNAALTIENCSIIGTISPDNPTLFNIISGEVILKNNSVSVTSNGMSPNPTSVSLYHVFTLNEAKITLSENTFTVDKPYTISVLVTGKALTKDFVITNNTFYQFHGGLFIDNSQNTSIQNNFFNQVSGSNIYLDNTLNSNIQHNTILFPGNNNVGDAIDIVDSSNINIINNYIGNDSCYSLYILNGESITIDNNKIVGGITYAISINSTNSLNLGNNNYLLLIYNYYNNELNVHKKMNNNVTNFNINVTNNYLSQNRYGLAAKNTKGLTVKNNFFIQHFSNAADRQFWTNNDILITESTDIIWEDNLYKEAYSQANDNENSLSQQFVTFPRQGGVIL
jgi:parallel beta helix pectate lyase-like protein